MSRDLSFSVRGAKFSFLVFSSGRPCRLLGASASEMRREQHVFNRNARLSSRISLDLGLRTDHHDISVGARVCWPVRKTLRVQIPRGRKSRPWPPPTEVFTLRFRPSSLYRLTLFLALTLRCLSAAFLGFARELRRIFFLRVQFDLGAKGC
jgi:hypothetical protein